MDILVGAWNLALFLAMVVFVILGVIYVGGALFGALVGGIWGIVTTLRGH